MNKKSLFSYLILLLILLSIFFSSSRQLNARPMVYDCFLFLNEFDILDIRLHEMDSVVDRFVIVESAETFRGKPKPLNFPTQAARFSQFAEKIIYVPLIEPFITNDPWKRETYQRNQMSRGLVNCSNKDIILISDVDEIVENKGVTTLCEKLRRKKCPYVGVNQRYHSNFLNSIPGENWRGTVATTYGQLKQSSPQRLRDMRNSVPAVAKGWHFTWQGGLQQDLYKLESYSHSESDTPEIRESKTRDALLRHLCPAIPVDESFPQYVRDNQRHFEEIGMLRAL